jgi:hypothetical protein
MTGLDELLGAAATVQSLLARRGWRFCFIGGVAVQRWGQPRFTKDMDVTLLTGFGEEEGFIDALLTELKPRRPDARDFALRHRVLFLRTAGDIEVDVALGALPFEERSVARASPWRVLENVELTTCCAEDLVVHKVFAGRGRDWDDVETVLVRQRGRLDFKLIRSELTPLLELKGELEACGRFDRMIATVERRLNAKP